jgi:tetrahydromethanopterin S-methyltransferase subunit C
MTFAGVNYIAVVIAALAGFGTGAVWYMALGRFWLAAVGKRKEDMERTPTPFLISIVANLVMAIMLAGVIGHLGEVDVKTGVISGGLIWLGFVITTMGVNHAFEGAKTSLTLIDGGHWLAVLLVMGAVIGAFGV